LGANEPRAGQIVQHYFLWAREQAAGQSEGAKPRPCLVLAVEPFEDGSRVTLLPITTRRPEPGASALEIPNGIKARIGMDDRRQSWLILDEANVFTWPGFDLVPQPNGGFAMGTVTSGFFRRVVDSVFALRARGRVNPVDRNS
jgi:hypothetical protein